MHVKVKIEVTSWFKRYTGGLSSLELELGNGETAWQAVCMAGIPYDEIGFITLDTTDENGNTETSEYGNTLTSKKIDDSYVAMDNDVLRVYPMIIGG